MNDNRKLNPNPGDEWQAETETGAPHPALNPWSAGQEKTPIFACEEGNQLASAVIDIAQPVLDRAKNLGELEVIMTVAVQVWNLSLLPATRQEQFLAELIRSFDLTPDQPQTLQRLIGDIEAMTQRRETRHANDRRIIVEHHLARRGESLILNVVGTATLHDEAA